MNKLLPRTYSVTLILALLASMLSVAQPVQADNTAQLLPFSQDWTNIASITTNNDWSGVSGIIGYRGDGLASTGNDPQTILTDGSTTPVNVNANQTNPNTFATGGVSEFHITDPVVALQGSGTADAPHIVIYLNTTGQSGINISYNLRDIDGAVDNAVQQVALQYRVGNSGNFTNIPAGFVADATTGPSLATLVTPVSVALPSAVDNQADVQIRIITVDAAGSDEWVGIDDISITVAGGSTDPSGVGLATPSTVAPGDPTLLTVNVTSGTNPTSTGLTVSCDLSSIGGSATQAFFDDGSNGDVTIGDNIFSFAATVDSGTSEGAKNLACSISDAETRTGNTSIALTVQEPVAIVINEILADPDATNGDANGDGTVVTTDDEFVEIVNNESTSLNISGWTLSDGVGVKHTFPANTIIPASCSVVVFAGGTPVGTFGRSLVQVSSTGQLGLNNTGDTVTLNNGSVNVASYTFGAEGGDNQSLTRDPDVTGADPLVKHSTATGSGGTLFSPGRKVDGGQFAGCPAELKIHDVQGSGAASPLAGQTVVVEGIVIGDFQDGASGTNGDFNGFHVQEEDVDADANPLTSEGIFVFDGNSPVVNVTIGDLVQVQGVVSEFNGLTEITSFTGVIVLSSGNSLPTASTLSLPVTAVSDFESYEGMRVTFPQALYISEYFNFDRFGELVLTSERHLTPTAEFEPGAPAIQAAADFLLDKITLDDGRSTQNPNPAIHPNGGVFDLTNLFRGGDTVANVTGIMDFSFGLYRIQPTQGAAYTSVNPRISSPDPVGGRLRVAAMNTLNFFITLDYPSGPLDNKCGPLLNVECRGADFDQPAEFARQRDKLLAALVGLNADVIGLNELENTLGVDPLGDPNGIVAGLNATFGPGTYSYINTGLIGTDAIRVGLVYKTTTVVPVGGFEILDSTDDPLFLDTKNRPSLAQTFEEISTGARFTVVVNHFKSKGSACNDVGDPDLGDGQGNCSQTRKNAAIALVNWLATDPTNSGDPDFLIMGDLNSYDKEESIDAILAGGFTDLIYQFHGEDAYSYVFDGQTGYLDYALANTSLLGQVTGVTEWHINADEPDLIDYDTSFKLPAQDAIYAPDAYRSSDHDPVIVGLELDTVFPTTAILDNFNRPNGNLGSNWKGTTSAYRIVGNQVDVRGNGPIYWKNSFGVDQEVYVTLTTVASTGWEQDLLLKVQGGANPNWGAGVIEVFYDATNNTVLVATFRPDTLAWYEYPAIPVTLSNGDQFGAQALSNGDVIIYRNGFIIGQVTLNAADQAFFNSKGGYIGLWFINAAAAFLDDFGGGNITP
jgi:predicted extracellular nuclease